ncbi:oleosin 1 [Sorghum bicolor]|uniref:Oleosin n=2 Tax=Sorghum bicolor TaxID=4558 RepID=A0A1B6QR90_SORBI|nr:oleosin 1 [Sorghum bicolor]KXG40436.1 hypothetical protein SORBI_3001G544400 [Sorghum bicolor]|eukprot:XP_002468711.2 oleosin 1 [Sorghum bicolor]
MATGGHHADDAHHHRGGGRRSDAVGENYMRGLYGDDDYNASHYGQQQSAGTAVAKALASATAAFTLLVLSGLAVTGTVLALIVATPLLVIFSPVLVPAAITVALLTTGFVSSGGFGAAAVAVLAWMYRYLQTTTSSSDQQQHQHQLSGKAHDVKDWAQHRLEQARAH